jgi:hypothetical protein
MRYLDDDFILMVIRLNLSKGYPLIVDLTESTAYIVLGFAPTFAALELSWRMGKVIGKRGELLAAKSQ